MYKDIQVATKIWPKGYIDNQEHVEYDITASVDGCPKREWLATTKSIVIAQMLVEVLTGAGTNRLPEEANA